MDQYAGTYTDEMYGDAKFTLENDKLVLTTPGFAGDLGHWNYDTFQVTWRDHLRGRAMVTFTLDARGRVDEMKLPDLKITFKRSPDPVDAPAALR